MCSYESVEVSLTLSVILFAFLCGLLRLLQGEMKEKKEKKELGIILNRRDSHALCTLNWLSQIQGFQIVLLLAL